MNNKKQIDKILYMIGFALIILGGAFFSIWNMNALGYILAIAGIIVAGIGKIMSK